jgi:hypothetical protein
MNSQFYKARRKLNILFICSLICWQAHCQPNKLDRVFSSLPNGMSEINGYEIQAKEITVLFDQDNSDSREALSKIEQSSKLNSSQLEELKKALLSKPKFAGSNICQYVYNFSENLTFVSRQQFDSVGNLASNFKTLNSQNEAHDYFAPIGSQTGSASIRKRGNSVLVGIPIFLSKLILRDFIIGLQMVSSEVGRSSEGNECNVLTIAADRNSPVSKYKIFISLVNNEPVQIDSYYTDGSLFSQTQLQFESPNSPPFLCKSAVTRFYENGKPKRLSEWTLMAFEKDRPFPVDSVASFLPPQTLVNDERFAKPISYHMGKHPPTSDEVSLMLTSKKGVAAYEAATGVPYPEPTSNAFLSKHRKWAKVIFLVLAVAPLIFFLPKLISKKK